MFQDVLLFELFQQTYMYLILFYFHLNQLLFSRQNLPVRNNYVLTESEVFTVKYQTEVLMY